VNRLPDYPAALSQALRVTDARAATPVETVNLAHSACRALAEPITADRDLPPFNRAMMDGYALRAAEFARDRAFRVVATIAAGAAANVRVPDGCCVKIATGAPLPDDCDSVIQHEASDRGDPVRFTIELLAKGNAVHLRGADARKGDVLVPAGTVLAAHHMGIAAAVGATTVRLRAKPQAWVLTSGDEVVSSDAPAARLLPHQIRNSNGVMVCELLHRMGAEPAHSQHVQDERQPTIEAVRGALDQCDLLITVGGVSAGERDHFPAAFDEYGVERVLVGAAIQPGRPIVVGRAASKQNTIVIALPGNPVSALACACLFAWPIVRTLLGLSATLPWRELELAEAVKPNAHRRAFRPAIVREDGCVTVPSWAGSGDLAHTAPTHGIVELPVQSEAMAAGARVRFLPWP
jgi:molybdopterin molybdotransferase